MGEREQEDEHTEYVISRRVHKQSGSLVLALPMFWAKAHGLEDKSEVTVVADGILEVHVPKKEGRRAKETPQ